MDLKREGWARVGLALATALIVTFGGVGAVDVAGAGPGCEPVSGSGSSEFQPPNVFTGTMNLTIGGEAFEATFAATLLGEVVSDEGVIHGTASHTIDLGNGTLTTEDSAVLEPTDIPGLFTLNERMKVVAGTEKFANASGQLHAHGVIDFYHGWASFEIHGVISR
jgi:hypothetical protein